MSPRGEGPKDGERPRLAIWRFKGDPRVIKGTSAEVVSVLRLRCQTGFPASMATGRLGPFCEELARRSKAAPVDPSLPDEAAAEALLIALADVGEAARVRPGGLRVVG